MRVLVNNNVSMLGSCQVPGSCLVLTNSHDGPRHLQFTSMSKLSVRAATGALLNLTLNPNGCIKVLSVKWGVCFENKGEVCMWGLGPVVGGAHVPMSGRDPPRQLRGGEEKSRSGPALLREEVEATH